ncbi:MAG: PEP-CTERM sorting domain-containing protein [Gammaproteobacteria bacterium]|nr:PEP-CTERM sorting domain-containing protein [Gammaproteobacteria bacterium]
MRGTMAFLLQNAFAMRSLRRLPALHAGVALAVAATCAVSPLARGAQSVHQDLFLPGNVPSLVSGPSTFDASIHLLAELPLQPWLSGDGSVSGQTFDRTIGFLPASPAYEVRTLNVSRVFASANIGGTTITLNNASLNVPTFVLGDNRGEGFAYLGLHGAGRLQSFGYAYLGYPMQAGSAASGVLELSEHARWFHNGFIGVGDVGGAGMLYIGADAEVSGGLGLAPNVFIGRRAIDPQWIHFGYTQEQLHVADSGRLVASELTIEGRARALGSVNAGLVRIQNDGIAQFHALDTPSLGIGAQGSARAAAAGFAGRVDLGTGAGNLGALHVNETLTVGAPGTGWYLNSLAAGVFGGTGELTVARRSFSDGVFMPGAAATLNVNGSVSLADGGSRASLRITDGGRMSTTGPIQAAIYRGGHATILIEGAGSRLTTPELRLAANESTQSYGNWGPGETGSGRLTLRDGGVLEIAGRSESFQMGDTEIVNHIPGRLVIGPDATLDGNGSVVITGPAGGDVLVMGTLSPGNSPGWLTIAGDLRLAGPQFGVGSSRLLIELGGHQAGAQYDVLEVLGNLHLSQALLEISLVNGFVPVAGASFEFLRVHGTITGGFTALVDHTGLGLTLAGLSFDGGNVSLSVTAVPEPGTYVLLLAGLMIVCGCARRRFAA